MENNIHNLCDQTLLIILDGYGINDNSNKNAIKDAKTPYIDQLFKDYPFTTIEAGGVSVGLPKGVPGNSEVGHMNLGAGAPVRQDLVRINECIEKNELEDLSELTTLINKAQSSSKRIHLMGLLSDGGVHSHIDHLKAFLKVFKSHHDLEIFFHAFMDGRDTPKTAGEKYLKELLEVTEDYPNFHFASMQGRSIGMDRDRRWEKIEHCYKTFCGNGSIATASPSDYLKAQYQKEIFDEFIEPTLFHQDFSMQGEDCVFFLNFRPDRAAQISLALNDPSFNEFQRQWRPAHYLCMTPYIPDELELPILFNKEKITGGLSEYLSNKNIKQFKIAETEKYAHVTYFFNGGEKKPFPNEEHFLIPSSKEVATYDQKPEMSAYEVTEKLSEALDQKDIGFYLVNYANSDMVGHTGNYEAAVKAIEALENCLKTIVDKCLNNNIAVIISADHGNSDQMVYEDGSAHTSHTGAPVPFCLIHPKLKGKEVKTSSHHLALKDVAPTVLTTLGLEYPKNFTGSSVFL